MAGRRRKSGGGRRGSGAVSAGAGQSNSDRPDAAAVCELCGRESLRFTGHHLTPRSQGGQFGPVARLCPTCHRQLHAMFSEATLARELNSIDRLRADPQFAEYLRWAQRQKGAAGFRVRRARHRR